MNGLSKVPVGVRVFIGLTALALDGSQLEIVEWSAEGLPSPCFRIVVMDGAVEKERVDAALKALGCGWTSSARVDSRVWYCWDRLTRTARA